MSYGIVSNVDRTGVEIIWETRSAPPHPFSPSFALIIASLSLSLSLSFSLSVREVWTGRFKRIPSVVGSARLAGSSWRHEAATTSAICFEYELTIALVKCHEHVYRCITTRMIRRSDSGFRGSLSVQEAYLRFSRGWNWVNGIGGIIGGTRIDEIPFVLFFFFFFFLVGCMRIHVTDETISTTNGFSLF